MWHRIFLFAFFWGLCSSLQAATHDQIGVQSGGAGSVNLLASVTTICGDSLYPTAVVRDGDEIQLTTPSINLGCAPPGPGGPPMPFLQTVSKDVSVGSDGVYFVTWTFPNLGRGRVLTTQFIVRGGQLQVYQPVPIGGGAMTAVLAMMVILATGMANGATCVADRHMP